MLGKRLLGLLLMQFLLCSLAMTEETACDHIWCPYEKAVHGVLSEEVTLYDTNEVGHLYMQWIPNRVCSICGEREYTVGGGAEIPHAYTVTRWKWIEPDESVQIVLTCGICEYEYTYEVTVQNLREGTGANCLHGGSCNSKWEGYQFENGMILFDTNGRNQPIGFNPGSKIVEEVLVYDPTEQTFLLTRRVYCPTCGRPRRSTVFEPQVRFDPDWNGLPIMTADYFLNGGVPENLPYQLIDQLREEAAAVQ